jgi:hypothetical protein
MKTKLLLSLFAVAFILIGSSRRANASGFGYVCNMQVVAASQYSSMGTAGPMYLSLYSGPACTGSFVAYFRFCSIGAPYCNQSSLFSDSQMRMLEGNLQRAQAANQRVHVSDNYEAGTASNMFFYAAGY